VRDHVTWKKRWDLKSGGSRRPITSSWIVESRTLFCHIFFKKNCRWKELHTETPANGNILLMEKILHQLINSLSHYLQGFIHHRWFFADFFHQQYKTTELKSTLYAPLRASPLSRPPKPAGASCEDATLMVHPGAHETFVRFFLFFPRSNLPRKSFSRKKRLLTWSEKSRLDSWGSSLFLG